jgi:hypothetical protein
MKYFFYPIALLLFSPSVDAQNALGFSDVPSIKIRKRSLPPSFNQALTLPQTATSCDCPSNNSRNAPLVKLGCQHPDTIAVCQVVITQFDLAIISPQGEAIVLKEIQGSFLNNSALNSMRSRYGAAAFISYTNIKGMTNNGKEVVVPAFGTQNPNQRAQRAYASIYDYTHLITKEDTKINSFELVAYNADNQMVFRQTYRKDTFDKNAMRSDAVRYLFRAIQVEHSSGFEIEMGDFEVTNITLNEVPLLSSSN